MKKLASISAALAIALASPASFAQEKVSIEKTSCREFLTLGGDDRDYVFLFFHGYMLGMSDQREYFPNSLAVKSDQFVQDCIDNPEKSAFSVMEAIYKKAQD
ncbi:MAG: HdeA/HdeB family chaperone [Pseudomonadota bacterium]